MQEGGHGSHAPVATLAQVAFGQKAVQAAPSRYGLLPPGTHAEHDALALWLRAVRVRGGLGRLGLGVAGGG